MMTMGLYNHIRLLGGCLLLALLSSGGPAFAEEDHSQLQKLKAAFLFNFLRYSDVPSSNASKLQLCLLGEEALRVEEPLQEVSGRIIDGKSVVILPLKSLPEKVDCDILYFEHIENPSRLDALRALTISVSPTPAMIQFTTVNDTLQFNVNLQRAKAKGIYLSSQLLRVAFSVQ
jgi:hypothetical protein